MVDMHAHILPGVDDGPETLAESIALIEAAAADGMTEIIATPHAHSPHYHVSETATLEGVVQLTEALEERDISMQLFTGQEVRIHDRVIERLESGEALTLANSKYMLLELPSSGIPAYTIPVIQGILSLGKVPIIAHPERNRAIAEKPSRLKRLITHGALAQVTAGSVAGYFGKNVRKLSMQLIEANLIHTYGSDMHNTHTRPAFFNEGLDYLEKHKHHDMVDILLENNARILSNEDFVLLEPQAVQQRKWWQLIG